MNGLKMDLHMHTWYSRDGIDPPSLILKVAAAKGLDVIAITDHNSVRGLREAKSCARSITVIPGIEVDTQEGHIIGLGIEKEIKPWMSAAETIDIIKDEGGMTLVPHPFDFLRRGVGFRVKTLNADAIEVMNSRYSIPFSNSWAKRVADSMRSPITAGSDAHLAEDVGDAYIIIKEDDNPSTDSVLGALTSSHRNQCRIVGKTTSLRSRVRKIALERMKRTRTMK